MKKNEKHLSLRIDADLLRQFDYVAKYDDRSMNWLLLKLVKTCIADFEREHGAIPEQKDYPPKQYQKAQKPHYLGKLHCPTSYTQQN